MSFHPLGLIYPLVIRIWNFILTLISQGGRTGTEEKKIIPQGRDEDAMNPQSFSLRSFAALREFFAFYAKSSLFKETNPVNSPIPSESLNLARSCLIHHHTAQNRKPRHESPLSILTSLERL